jgi:hypothetical protein
LLHLSFVSVFRKTASQRCSSHRIINNSDKSVSQTILRHAESQTALSLSLVYFHPIIAFLAQLFGSVSRHSLSSFDTGKTKRWCVEIL